MGKSKKRRLGATSGEMLQLIAKAQEILKKKPKEETKTENNKSGHSKDSKCKEDKQISSSAAQKKTRNITKTKANTKQKSKSKTKDKTEKKAHTKPTKKVKEQNSENIKRGATPEEMLLLIAKGEEREAKEAKEKVNIENIATAKTETGFATENKKLQSLDTPTVETKNSFIEIIWYILRPNSTKIKVAAVLALATLSATALTFGLSVVNFSPEVVRNALKIPEQAQIVTIDFTTNDIDMYHETVKVSPAQPKKATLTVMNAYHQINRAILTTGGNININLIQSSDNNLWEINFGSNTSFDFSDISIPANALIKSVVVFVEHFEEEGFNQGELEWAIVTGQPTRSVVLASIKAPVQIGESDEAIDSWDITSLVDTCEKINSFQLQVKNNNNVTESKTLIDYAYVTVRWE
ncbi:MAG: hypothetical protein GY774_33575 [Planctomycetes bacterium]|nr:hypothetical protein [Planctomycetota bacterium]